MWILDHFKIYVWLTFVAQIILLLDYTGLALSLSLNLYTCGMG